MRYNVTITITALDDFESEDIPEGMTPEEYAEARYVDGEFLPDDHSIEVTAVAS